MCAITDNGREGGERLTPLGIRYVIAGGGCAAAGLPGDRAGGRGYLPSPPVDCQQVVIQRDLVVGPGAPRRGTLLLELSGWLGLSPLPQPVSPELQPVKAQRPNDTTPEQLHVDDAFVVNQR